MFINYYKNTAFQTKSQDNLADPLNDTKYFYHYLYQTECLAICSQELINTTPDAQLIYSLWEVKTLRYPENQLAITCNKILACIQVG